MSLNETLGYEGIFICDSCLKAMNLDRDQIEAVKGYGDAPANRDLFRCHVCNQQFNLQQGVFILPNKMADLIETSVSKIDEMYQKIRGGRVTCAACGTEQPFNDQSKITCINCNANIILKDEIKKYKLGFVKKTAMGIYIRSLRKIRK
jgi:hypothetical protein